MPSRKIERVQTGVRIEKRLLKVLKGLAEYFDMSVGDLLEGIVLHSFDGKLPFDQKQIQKINSLKKIYDLDLTIRQQCVFGGRAETALLKPSRVAGDLEPFTQVTFQIDRIHDIERRSVFCQTGSGKYEKECANQDGSVFHDS